MTALRFCHVTTFYPPYSFGGDGIAVQRLCAALARRGHDVTVIHARDAFDALSSGSIPAEAGSGPVHTIGLTSRLGRVAPLLTHQLGRPVIHARRLQRLLAGERFDVIHFHNVSLVGGPGVLAYGDATKLYTAHEHWLVCPTHVLWRDEREPCDEQHCLRCVLRHHRPPQAWRYSSMLNRHLDHVDAFIALSEFSRRKHAEFGFPRPMEVLPLFVPDPRPVTVADPLHPRPFVLYVGRLERLKGLEDVLTVFDGELGVDLLIAGSGTDRSRLVHLASSLPSVRFLGWVDQAQLGSWYQQALAVIVPTLGYETFGQSVIEAFSHGVPVVARATGPLPELVEGAGGGEVFSEPAQLRGVLRRLLASPERCASLGRAGRTAFEAHYSEEVVLPGYLDIVHRATAARSRDTGGEGPAAGTAS